jgi:CRP-like cAMP-binding protein
VPLFQRLPKDQLPTLAAVAEDASFEQEDVIIKQGDVGEDFYVIKTGLASVWIDGNKVAELKEQNYFGEAALLYNEPRTATIKAITHIDALKITRANFQRLGLHQKLTFPKREKINRRHKMMAAGAAGVKQQEK